MDGTPSPRLPPSALQVTVETRGGTTVLYARGCLDSSTYLRLRDTIIKAALRDVRGVVVDVNDLEVPAESAWAAFTSARWHVTQWPEVPIVLVCGHLAGRRAIARNGVSRYVPVYASCRAALDALAAAPPDPSRRRIRAQLPIGTPSLPHARRLVADTLAAWSQTELIAVAKVVVTTFVENVLTHTNSASWVLLETDGRTVTVAVEDNEQTRPVLQEKPAAGVAPSGLRTVAALVRAWGSAPTPTGKTVWAVLGPENQL